MRLTSSDTEDESSGNQLTIASQSLRPGVIMVPPKSKRSRLLSCSYLGYFYCYALDQPRPRLCI
jgi:hypothetical protein